MNATTTTRTIHVSFSCDGYGDPGDLSPDAWKAAADRLMVEYLESRGYSVVVDDYEANESQVLLDGEDVTSDWGPEMWQHACETPVVAAAEVAS